MKHRHLSYLGASLLSILAEVIAFPGVLEASARDRAERHIERRQGVPDLTAIFNEKLQYVSTTGKHAWVAPDLAGGDQRGPCPGLNAMANHGYIPHNGVGTHLDFIKGTFDVFGMAADMSGFLTVLGGVVDGDGLSWSIGGPSKANSGIALGGLLGGLLGVPQGLSGSHNKYESDVSPGRGDLYLKGNDFTLQMDQYQQLYEMGQANGDVYDLTVLTDFRSKRFDQSVQQNPYFFNGPFTGVLVQPAAYSFIYRFMSNKSAEHPAGRLNGDVLNSFFGVVKNTDGSLTHTPGSERIPDNWYKRAVGDEYTIPFLQADTLVAAAKYPKFLNIGGNTGKTNTFVGVNAEDITGGVYNSKTLAEGNNLACFAMQFAVQASPDIIQCSNVLSGITGALLTLTSQAAASLSALSCPQLSRIDQSQFKQFPGYADLHSLASDGKYTVRVLARSCTSPEAIELSSIPGVTLFTGDSYDEVTLRRAFAGVSYAFVNTNGFAIGEKAEMYWGIRMYELARETGVRHYIWAGLIYSSKLGGFDPKYKCGHLDGKERVSDYMAAQSTEPMKWSILTSCLYVEGLNDFLRPRLGVAKEKEMLAFVAPLGKGDLPLIYLEDYGAYARWMLDTPEKSTGLDLYVATEDIPWDKLAADFTEVTGKKAVYADVTLDEYFSLGIFPRPEAVIGKSAVNENDNTLVTVRQNFSGFWNSWKDNLSTRDYALLDEILPTRTKSVKEWMIKTGYTGEYSQVLKHADRSLLTKVDE